MARALETDPINQLEENLECTVCLEPLKDPRTLPCFHSFCKDCLEGVVKTCRDKAPRGRPIREFPCPNCRETFTLDPDKQVADMRVNHFICNIVKATAVLDRGIGVPCSHNCSQSYSVARCVTCEKFLCRECLTGHNNYRANTGHSVLTMEELSKPENRKKIKDKMYCNEHHGEVLKVYCETCDQLICKDCMDFKHVKQYHSCFLVKDVANNYKELLASNNKTMEDVLTENNTFLKELSRTTERLDRDAENIKSKIIQRKEFMAKKVVEMLDDKAETLLNEVEAMHKEARGDLDKQTGERKVYVENVQRSVQLSKRLADQGTEEEIISSQKMMLHNANNLLTKRQEHFKAPIPVVKFSYTACDSKVPLNEEIMKGVVNSLGEVNKIEGEAGNEKNKENLSSMTKEQPQAVDKEATKESSSKGKTGASLSKAESATGEKVRIEKLSCVLFQNVKVSGYQGDITKETVDVIANSANEELKHCGGAAGAIVKAGGKSIQDESEDIMKKRRYKNLIPGEVVATKAGNLPCNLIIHAVGPRWANYDQKDKAKNVLYNAVFNCLVVASQNGAKSISMPAISSGIFGVPVPICAEVLFAAATNFAKDAAKSNHLKDIRFVNIDKPTAQVFAQEMKKRFGTAIQRENVEVFHSNNAENKRKT